MVSNASCCAISHSFSSLTFVSVCHLNFMSLKTIIVSKYIPPHVNPPRQHLLHPSPPPQSSYSRGIFPPPLLYLACQCAPECLRTPGRQSWDGVPPRSLCRRHARRTATNPRAQDSPHPPAPPPPSFHHLILLCLICSDPPTS